MQQQTQQQSSPPSPRATVKELIFASEQALLTAKLSMSRGDQRGAESALRLAQDLHRQAVATRQARS